MSESNSEENLKDKEESSSPLLLLPPPPPPPPVSSSNTAKLLSGITSNDDGASVSSSSSTISSSSEDNDDDNNNDGSSNNNHQFDWDALTLDERRARKIARNERKLKSLGLDHRHKSPLAAAASRRRPAEEDYDEPSSCSRGILLDLEQSSTIRVKFPKTLSTDRTTMTESPPTVLVDVDPSTLSSSEAATTTTACHDEPLIRILRAFPGREAGVRALYAHLDFATRGYSTKTGTVPAPIWITGPSGSGKSSLTRAVLEEFLPRQQRRDTGASPTVLLVSYVDAAALQPSVSVEAVVNHVYRDLMQQFSLDAAPTRRRKRKRATVPQANDDHAQDKDNGPAPRRRSLRARDPTVNYTGTTTTTVATAATTTRGNKLTAAGAAKSKTSRLTAQDMAESTAPKTSGSYTAIWTLGRLWKSLAGTERPCVLVLDEIWSSTLREFNLLAQFLLLPRQLQMNLTIIVITKNILLDQTRLNMMTNNSSSTLANCIQPTRIHFPAYRGRLVFETILLIERNRVLIVGRDSSTEAGSFLGKVYQSFVRTLVQSIYDLTKSIKEIIRFGRILWLRYTEVLRPSKIDATLELVKRKLASYQPPLEATPAHMEQELLAYLDRKILSQIRSLTEQHLFALSVPYSGPTTYQTMPNRAKYLLLAAYLCQVNRPDRDKHLFSIQKNGRRRKSNTEGNTASEDTAFGNNTASMQPRSLRLRTFPLERMLSIFVSLVTLHQLEAHKDSSEEPAENLLSLGDPSLQQNLSYLQSLGLLHEQPASGSTDFIRLTGRRYWCDMTEDEAMCLADRLQFPLTRYLL